MKTKIQKEIIEKNDWFEIVFFCAITGLITILLCTWYWHMKLVDENVAHWTIGKYGGTDFVIEKPVTNIYNITTYKEPTITNTCGVYYWKTY